MVNWQSAKIHVYVCFINEVAWFVQSSMVILSIVLISFDRKLYKNIKPFLDIEQSMHYVRSIILYNNNTILWCLQ